MERRLSDARGSVRPRGGNRAFEIFLAASYPGTVVFLRDLDRLMTEQNGNLFEGDAGQEEVHGEGVAELMRVTLYLRCLEDFPESSPSVAGRGVDL